MNKKQKIWVVFAVLFALVIGSGYLTQNTIVSTCLDNGCRDSDGTGLRTDNFYVAGVLEKTYNGGTTWETVCTDECSGSKLYECYIVTDAGKQTAYESTYTCPNGCAAGACIKTNPTTLPGTPPTEPNTSPTTQAAAAPSQTADLPWDVLGLWTLIAVFGFFWVKS